MDKAALALNKAHKSIPILVAAAVSATALLAPPKAHAQKCTGNINVGCLHPGAACSPVTIGLGPSGHCKTPAGLPPGERECECTGKPAPTRCSAARPTPPVSCRARC